MQITYLAAGAAGMYCGSCLHDNTLTAAMRSAGAEILLVPTYTPIRTDEPDMSQRPVMLGGINMYLQQRWRLFRHTPRFFDRWLDSPTLLNWLSQRNLSVKAEDLGDLTVSLLWGEAGNQRKEVLRLVKWLKDEVRPDVVHLSNSMLCGLAREINRQLQIPVVCSLSGEDLFLEQLRPPFYEQAREALRERAQDIAAFVSLNQYYAGFMAEYLAVDRERIRVIPHGLDLTGHGTRRRADDATAFTIGYFARICPEKGLHLLVEAFKLLCEDPRLPPLRLRAAGYLGGADRPYLAKIQSRVAALGLQSRFEYLGELDRAQKIAFYQSLDVMSVPTVYRESKGLPMLEALANAVPVVMPSHGSFPEMIEDTGGGLLCRPEDPADLAHHLKRLIENPLLSADLGQRGQTAVRDRYTAQLMAQRHEILYRDVLADASHQRENRPQEAI
jgi:glycosyltransferase involved in cell wall biosynthesis